MATNSDEDVNFEEKEGGGEEGWDCSREDIAERTGMKVVVVGDGMVGKTSMLFSFILNRFPTEHVPTVFANHVKDMFVCEEPVKLWLCDTAGQEEMDRLRVMSYPDTKVFLVCFSVTDPKSLVNVTEKWVPEIRFHCPQAQSVLVANKVDLRFNEQEIQRLAKDGLKPVSEEQGEQLSFKLRMDAYHECSALTQDGLTEVFDKVARLALSPSNKPDDRSRSQKGRSFFKRSRKGQSIRSRSSDDGSVRKAPCTVL